MTHPSTPNALQIEPLTVGELQTQCYLLWCSETNEAVVVDPGDSGDLISERILHHRLTPTAILLTHGHFDHVLGLLELTLNFPVPVFLHPEDAFLLQTAQQSARHWLKHPVDPVPADFTPLQENHLISFGRHQLQVIHTPGHTPGSVSFVHRACVLSGDTLFAHASGRTDFTYSDKNLLRKSLQKLLALPAGLRVYPGHGNATVIAAERLFWSGEQ